MDDETTTIREIKEVLKKSDSIEQNQSPNVLAKSIVVESGELLQIFQYESESSSAEITTNELRKVQVEQEVVDILGYTLALAEELNISISTAVENRNVDLEDK